MMKLTFDYRCVKALFNTPPEREIKYEKYLIDSKAKTQFTVGPFTYLVQFYPDDNDEDSVRVEFKLIDIRATGDELVEMMLKVRQGLIKHGELFPEDENKPMYWEEAQILKKQVLERYGYLALEIAGSSAIRILGNVLNIIKGYVEKHRGSRNCISFSADLENRARVYLKMVQQA